jgi:ubiquinone/menaquinone biosynthesis C-methylase UbiE
MCDLIEVTRWNVPVELTSSPAVANRNALARNLATRDVPSLLGSYVYLSVLDMRRLVSRATRYLLPGPFQGVGVELGAGCGLLSAIVAFENKVKNIYAVEVCEDAANLLIPKVVSSVLGRDASKVVPVVGSFDDLQLPAKSVDFVVEFDSLHHSDNLERTLSESARVLKPGGWMLCFDRAQPDTVTDEEIEEMLSKVYSREFLEKNYYPVDIPLTRRENGEHEYRLSEWKSAFESADFRLEKTAKFEREVRFKTAMKGVLSVFPGRIRRLLYKSEGPTLRTVAEWTSQRTRRMTRYWTDASPIYAPKETTVFFCERN